MLTKNFSERRSRFCKRHTRKRTKCCKNCPKRSYCWSWSRYNIFVIVAACCLCGDWVPELLNRRAQQVVDREAPWPLAPAIRQQRVAAMAQKLQTNHECGHSGKFTKLEGSRRGKVREMCGTRHRKHILSCKRCHMLACEDRRRHRL